MADVTVKLTVGNFSVKVEGNQKYVDKKVDELLSRFLSSPKAAAAEQSARSSEKSAATGKKTSPAELLKNSSAKNQMDRALVLGFYLENFSGASSFTSNDLAHIGKQTKQPFTNASDAIAKLSGRGLMMSAGDREGKRAYALTASGEAYVDGLMEPNPK